MNLEALRRRLRTDILDDVQAPRLWSDEQLDAYINEAAMEAAVRSPWTCGARDVVPFTALEGERSYPLPAGTIAIDRVRMLGKVLTRVALADLPEARGAESRKGAPSAFVFESSLTGGAGTLDLYPLPSFEAPATAELRRTPDPLVNDEDEPVAPVHVRPYLLEWAAYRAFSLRDSDSSDLARAARHEANFTTVFGPRFAMETMRTRTERRRHVVKINSAWG